MSSGDLTDRALFALRWLDSQTDPAPPEPMWAVPARTAYAFLLADALGNSPFARTGANRHRGEVNAAANTLVALKRRGLAANDGGGAWLQAKWWITAAGREVATETGDA